MAIGLAYRPEFRIELFAAPQIVDYLEITAEHFLDLRGAVRDDLDALKATFPIVVHALGLSIGSADGLDARYVDRLAHLLDFVRPLRWSDHLGFTRAGGIDVGHFLPLRRDAASIEIVARNAATLRRTIGLPFALENLTSPFVVPGATLDEATFLMRTAHAAQCTILLDIENLHANERNWNESAQDTIAAVPAPLIAEVHVAGGRQTRGHYVDSHDAPISARTWELLAFAAAGGRARTVTLERDARIVNLAALAGELDAVRACQISASGDRRSDEAGVALSRAR